MSLFEKKITLAERLRRHGEAVKGEIKQKIISTDTIKTGDLLRSVDYLQVVNSIQFSMLDYGKFTDEGTIYIAPRKFFNETIDKRNRELEESIGQEVESMIDRIFEESGKLRR